MFSYLMMMFHQVLECIRGERFSDLVRKRIYKDRVLVPAEMDLIGEIPFFGHKNQNYQFVEVRLEDLENKKFTYAIPSRYYKALRNLKKGFRNFAILTCGVVVGDVWSTATEPCGKPYPHGDAYITGLCCEEWEIYAFDMAIESSFRGKNLAVPLQRFLQSTLKGEGYKKVYGYYWEDNLSALWMHRLLKFKEYPKRQVTRVLMYYKVEDYDYANQPVIFRDIITVNEEYCWDYKNCSEETKTTCLAFIQSEKQCWELFMEDGALREKCKTCQFRMANMPASKVLA